MISGDEKMRLRSKYGAITLSQATLEDTFVKSMW